MPCCVVSHYILTKEKQDTSKYCQWHNTSVKSIMDLFHKQPHNGFVPFGQVLHSSKNVKVPSMKGALVPHSDYYGLFSSVNRYGLGGV